MDSDLLKLEIFNDPKFKFVEDTHTYTYDNVKLQSVTNFISQFKNPFDVEESAAKIAIKRKVDVEIILNEWTELRDKAANLGTIVHKWIEDYLAESDTELIICNEVLSRVNKFIAIRESRLKELIPVKQELRVFSPRWGLAGTIDALFRYKSLNIIGDWKTNKVFKTDSHYSFRKKLLYPFNDLDDNHINIYSIQLCTYRLILKEFANFDIHSGFLCHIGPTEAAQVYQIKDLRAKLIYFLNNNKTV